MCATLLYPLAPFHYPSNLYNKSSGIKAELIHNYLVRVEGVEPSSHAWEAYIIAVIRYPQASIILAHWRHEHQGLAAHLTAGKLVARHWAYPMHRPRHNYSGSLLLRV